MSKMFIIHQVAVMISRVYVTIYMDDDCKRPDGGAGSCFTRLQIN